MEEILKLKIINLIEKYPSKSNIESLSKREYRTENHNKLNDFLTQLFPNTFLVAFPGSSIDDILLSVILNKGVFCDGTNNVVYKMMKQSMCHDNRGYAKIFYFSLYTFYF